MRSLFSCLEPDFVWSAPAAHSVSETIPPVPSPTPWLLRRLWGYVHKSLVRFSIHYARWSGIPSPGQIWQLPFGLILKWSDGTRVEEALTMQVMHAAGLPVPKVVCYGEHANSDHAPVSILMTRMPGYELGKDWWEYYDEKEKAAVVAEMKMYLDAIRQWKRPECEESRLCSIAGTSLRSVCFPRHQTHAGDINPSHYMEPCIDEAEFNRNLMYAANMASSEFDSQKLFAETRKLHKVKHKIVFTHGDVMPQNILVTEDGHLSAILDWEAAGWYPDYWEFSTALRWYRPRTDRPNTWWYTFMRRVTDDRYLEERKGDLAMRALTQDALSF